MPGDLLAGLHVTDYERALTWYQRQRLLGSEPAFVPNDVEAVWELDEHRYPFIEVRPGPSTREPDGNEIGFGAGPVD